MGIMSEQAERSLAPTLKQCLEKYINDREQSLSASTIKGYRKISNTRFQRYMNRRIDSIDYQFMLSCEMRDNDISAKTVHNSFGLIHAAVTAANYDTGKVSLPQKVRNERSFLTLEQAKVFLKGMEGDSAELAALLCLSSLRLSEVKGLKWGNLTEDVIRVRGAAVYNSDGKLVYQDTNKNEQSNRDVPVFLPQLAQIISREKPQHDDSDYVVTIAENTIYRHVTDCCRRNGLPVVSPHGLRHSFASIAYGKLSEEECMRLGGWKDIYTMRRIYTHLAQEQLQEAGDKLKSLF